MQVACPLQTSEYGVAARLTRVERAFHATLTPWLQPGGMDLARREPFQRLFQRGNLLKQFACASQCFHRAEASVLMRLTANLKGQGEAHPGLRAEILDLLQLEAEELCVTGDGVGIRRRGAGDVGVGAVDGGGTLESAHRPAQHDFGSVLDEAELGRVRQMGRDLLRG